MRTYQTLSLIGCIIGILLTIGLAIVIGGLMSASDVLMNMSRPTESELQRHIESQETSSLFVGGAMFAFLLYIVILVITFAVKRKTKAVGIAIIILGIITMAVTNGWGIIPFALLLPAGIVALRYKKRSKITQPKENTDSQHSKRPNSNSFGNSGGSGEQNVAVAKNIPSTSSSAKNEDVDTSHFNQVAPIPTDIILNQLENSQDDEDYDEEEDEDNN
jgi:hypothetical protein